MFDRYGSGELFKLDLEEGFAKIGVYGLRKRLIYSSRDSMQTTTTN